MIHHVSQRRWGFGAALALLASSVLAVPALASPPAVHVHPAERGTVDRPLSVVRPPTDLPPPIVGSGVQTVTINLETVEVTATLDDGASYHYWTFDGQVPGPFVRVRVGDTVLVQLANAADSHETHSVDFHAATGPGGGGAATQAAPGETREFTFKAINPGLYVYHCATPTVAEHIAAGMYGLILVEPEGGLREVDREFYVMQGEIYTAEPFGAKGGLTRSRDKLLSERPEFFVFNGAVGGLSEQYPLTANVGETIRIFVGVGGPNYVSSFHVIGEIFDRVLPLGSVTAEPLSNVQTIVVPPGGASVVEFRVEVPGRYLLVDHALARLERGLVGVLEVDGPENPEIFSAPALPGAAHAGH